MTRLMDQVVRGNRYVYGLEDEEEEQHVEKATVRGVTKLSELRTVRPRVRTIKRKKEYIFCLYARHIMFFTYTGIRVKNLKRSLEFYENVMDMRVILKGKMKHGGVFVHLKSPRSQQRLELNYYPKGNEYFTTYKAGEELDHLAFWSEDVKRDFTKLVSKGARGTVSPFKEGRYQLTFVKDPDGIWIELIGKEVKRS